MGGFNLVSQGATSAVDPSKAAAMKRKQLRDVMRNNQREWTEAKVRQGKYLEPAFYKKVIKEKGPIKLLHSNIKVEPRPALFPKHLDFNLLKISTLNLPANKRLFGFDPVDLVGGGYVFNRREPLFPSSAPIEWAWNWNSQSEYAGSLGNKIQFSFDAHLIYSKEDMRFCYNDLEGRKMLVPYLETGKTYYHEPFYLRFERSEDGWLIYHLETQIYCFFKEQQTSDVYRLAKAWKGAEEYTFDYDSEDRLSQISDNHQHRWKIDYNDRNLIQQVTREGTRLVSYEYDSLGNLTKVTNQAGHSMAFYYQEYLLIRRKDECGYSFFWQYDKEERVTRTWGEGHVLEGSLTYNDEELYTLTTDGLGSETQYFYNNQGIVTQIDYGDDTSEFFEYDKEERLIRKQHRNRTETTYKYNELGLLTEERHSNGTFLLIEYDELGRWIKKETLESNLSCCYESFGAVKEIRKDGEILESYQHDEESHLPIKTHKNGIDYIYQYDTKNQSVIIKAQDGTKLWKYNDVNQLIQYEDEEDVYQFIYTKMGQLAQVTKDGQEISNFIYDAKGRVIVSTINGQKTEWVYDGLDHVVKENDGTDELTYSYNKNGQISQIKLNRESLLTLKRNSHGQIIEQEIAGLPKLFYGYDDDGRVNEIYTNDEHITFRYDEKSRVFEKINNHQLWEKYDYYEDGKILNAATPFSSMEFKYDELNNLIEEKLFITIDESTEEIKLNYEYQNKDLSRIMLNGSHIVTMAKNEAQIDMEVLLFNQKKLYYQKMQSMQEEKIYVPDCFAVQKKITEKEAYKKNDCKDDLVTNLKKLKTALYLFDISNQSQLDEKTVNYQKCLVTENEQIFLYDPLGRLVWNNSKEYFKKITWVNNQVFGIDQMDTVSMKQKISQHITIDNTEMIMNKDVGKNECMLIKDKRFDEVIHFEFDSGKLTKQNIEKGGANTEDLYNHKNGLMDKFRFITNQVNPEAYLMQIFEENICLTPSQVNSKIHKYINQMSFGGKGEYYEILS